MACNALFAQIMERKKIRDGLVSLKVRGAKLSKCLNNNYGYQFFYFNVSTPPRLQPFQGDIE